MEGGQVFICSLAKGKRQSIPAVLSPYHYDNTLLFWFYGKKLGVKIKQNWCNADQVLSLVAPSGEQELTKNY